MSQAIVLQSKTREKHGHLVPFVFFTQIEIETDESACDNDDTVRTLRSATNRRPRQNRS